MKRTKPLTLIGALVAITFLLIACGSGDPGDSAEKTAESTSPASVDSDVTSETDAPSERDEPTPAESDHATTGTVATEIEGPQDMESVLDQILAVTKDGPFTLRDMRPYLSALIKADAPEGTINSLLLRPPNVLNDLAKNYLVHREIVRTFIESGKPQSEKVRDTIAVNNAREALFLIRAQIDASLEDLPEDEARAYYEKNQIEFRTPLRFWMRHLSLLAYVPYVSAEGDTLESIAKQISGSEEYINRILTDAVTKLPRWVPPDDRDTRPFIPLTPGERLLVPMGPADRKAVHSMLENDMLSKLNDDFDFAMLCQRFSEADDKGDEIGPLPFGTTPMLTEILEAGKTLPIGELSPVIETKHGFEILQITERKAETQLAFDEALERIRETHRAEDSVGRETKLVQTIWTHATINVEVLLDPIHRDDAIAIECKTRKWTKGDIKRHIPTAMKTVSNQAALMDALRNAIPVFSVLAIEYAQNQGIFDDEEFAERIQMQTQQILANALIREVEAAALAGIAEESVKAYYQKHIDVYTPPLSCEVRQIVVNLDPEADLDDPEQRDAAERKALKALRENANHIKNIEDFIEAVHRVSEDDRSVLKDGIVGRKYPKKELPGTYGEILMNLPENTPSEPFVHQGAGYILWVDKINAAEPKLFEDVRASVEEALQYETRIGARQNMVGEALERIRFRTPEKKP